VGCQPADLGFQHSALGSQLRGAELCHGFIGKETFMAAGAKPALDPMVDDKAKAQTASDAKPATLKERILRKLTEIFEYNERLGSTRQ
jgi:hypothetical protein